MNESEMPKLVLLVSARDPSAGVERGIPTGENRTILTGNGTGCKRKAGDAVRGESD